MEAKGELMTTQLRRIHIIYFLSRMGRIEHPHLIRVHHLSRNGVYLRDVKRWLSDLRGKDMPESFAWSYKRRYKAGYVWQDLVDEDLITPIADNEFVLKGSEISSFPLETSSCGEKKVSTENLDPVEDKLQKSLSGKNPEIPNTKIEVSVKTTEIELEEESSEPLDSETSTTTDDSMKSSVIKEKKEEKNKPPLTSTSATFSKSKSYSNGASQVFRNLLTCGAVDTNDSVMTVINRVQRTLKNSPERIDGSEGIFGGDCNQQPHQQNSRRSSNGMKNSKKTNENQTVSAARKPVAEPICSQCGKKFKPEKLHSHMKSCKGMKSHSKTGGVDAATMAPEKISSRRSTDASSKDVSTYFLTR